MNNKMLAAVDMGTNSFHMIVVKVHPNGRFCKVDSHKEYVRLGSGTLTSTGFIGSEEETRALDCMKRFKILADSTNSEMRIVATSAVREAKNRGKFVKRISDVAGVNVEVLSGKEEARLIYFGILQALPVYEKAVLTVDIGGGSTEFVLGHRGEVIHATSLKLGHIRLTESFLKSKDGKLNERQIEEMRRHIRAIFADSDLVDKVREIGFDMAIGSSGTIESIEQVIHQGHAVELNDGPDSMPVFFQAFRGCEFTNVELNVIVTKLCKANNTDQRAKLLGFSERRLDSIVAGAILLQEIFEILGIDKMTVSSYALREGLIADTLAKTCNGYNFSPNVRWNSVTSLARRFNNKKRMKSDMHSVQLAKDLLEGLQKCKEGGQDCFSAVGLSIDENDIELMEAAILLHNIGLFINYKGYHKHSYYLIKNNEHLHGYSSMDIEMIALLARYHRKKFPSRKHGCFAKLSQEVSNGKLNQSGCKASGEEVGGEVRKIAVAGALDVQSKWKGKLRKLKEEIATIVALSAQKKVRALCAIIRIVVALERSNFSAIQQVDVKYEKGVYTIVVTPSLIDPLSGLPRDISLEVWAAQSEFIHFEEVFGRKMSITVSSNLVTN